MLNDEQFENFDNIPHPYTRLRKSYAQNMALRFVAPDEIIPYQLHPSVMLPVGSFMANKVTEVALNPKFVLNEGQLAKRELLEHGFRKRHETKKRWASFNN